LILINKGKNRTFLKKRSSIVRIKMLKDWLFLLLFLEEGCEQVYRERDDNG
jgi:hypothetical protein